MKFISVFLLLFSTILLSQTDDYKSIQGLRNELKYSDDNFESARINLGYDLSKEKKSAGLGIIYSLLLPGMGELYADSYSSGKYFTIADGILWGTLIGFSAYSSWQESNYMSYAAARAGVNNNNKDDNYYSIIGDYSSIYAYNNEKALERNFDQMYNEQQYYWEWNSTEERRTYRDMWTSSEQASNNIRFVVGGLILNRVISAINAVRLISSYNKRLEEEVSWNFSVGFMNQPNLPTSIALNVRKSF
jgi:hypothetical protein